jgi:hypothetical protein
LKDFKVDFENGELKIKRIKKIELSSIENIINTEITFERFKEAYNNT